MSDAAARSQQARTGGALAASSAFLAAAFFIPYKLATGYAPPAAVVVALLAPAAVLNTVAAWVAFRGSLRIRAFDLRVAGVIAVFTVTGNVAMVEALSLIDAGVISVLMQTQVFFVAVAGWILLRERVTARFGVGVGIALVGIALTRVTDDGVSASGTAGALWAIAASASFAMTHVVTRKYIDRINPVPINALRLWMAVAVLMVLPGRASVVAAMPTEAWLYGAAAALFGPFAARLSIMFAVRYVAAARAALFGLLTPVFAYVLEAGVLGVIPGTRELAGAAVILIGVALPVYGAAARR